MKLISWNVNGIRSVAKKGFLDFVRRENPDVLCLQETRANGEQTRLEIPGYRDHWHSAQRPGYAGTATYAKIEPAGVRRGLGAGPDAEGRVLTAEFDGFFLVNVYTPNSKRDLSRLDYRRQWDRDFLLYLKKIEKKKPVVFCGDLNVAHREIDLTYPKANRRNHGFTDEEREGFDRILRAGFLDSFRVFHSEGGHYTWWSRLNHCRQRNIGWRIDYFCVSESLRPRLLAASIFGTTLGSDHCPVGLEIRE